MQWRQSGLRETKFSLATYVLASNKLLATARRQ